MIALGAVGAQVVQDHLNVLGHEIVELERGSLFDEDLERREEQRGSGYRICAACHVVFESSRERRRGPTCECRTLRKTRNVPGTMACSTVIGLLFRSLSSGEDYWSAGALDAERSLWRERILTSWKSDGYLNLFKVESFRGAPFVHIRRKGVTEGSEVQIKWSARFASEDGRVTRLDGNKIHYAPVSTPERERHYRLGANLRAGSSRGREVRETPSYSRPGPSVGRGGAAVSRGVRSL